MGIVPNLKVKWLAKIEELLRRGVHAWFLVPAGVERVIGILEDASFDPSPGQLNLIPEDQKNRVWQLLEVRCNIVGPERRCSWHP